MIGKVPSHDRDIDRACNLLSLSAVLASKDWRKIAR